MVLSHPVSNQAWSRLDGFGVVRLFGMLTNELK